MWLVTTLGFFSVVAHRDDLDLVLVRGRSGEDLAQLRAFAAERQIPLPDVLATPTADYGCRLFVTRQDWEQLAAALAAGIDYPNFKEAVHGDAGRDAAYLQMWAAMRRFQAQKAGDVAETVRPAWSEPGGDYFQSAFDYMEEEVDDWYDEGPSEEVVFAYLDELRDSGVTNMFGARPYLQDEFGFDKKEAGQWLTQWMQTYAGRHGLEA